ncbi:MAG: cupin domain-containing protein [Candidatus Eremiobacteraeota bacterium]|nr:cupin domain-containing protein [Candidatus Eremiobacteraeota bacterium]
MLRRLCIPGVYSWSATLAEEPFVASSHLVTTVHGNVAVDPLPLDEAAHRQIEALGGIGRVIVTIAEREATAKKMAARYGAAVVGQARHREKLFAGGMAIELPDQELDGEFAVLLPSHRAVIIGRCVAGTPAGALSLRFDRDDAGACKAALGLRRVLQTNPEHLLTGLGDSIFFGAYAALYRALHERAGASIHRVNLDELDYRDEREERVEQPDGYHCIDAEVGFTIGARALGYRVSTLGPGQRFCPLHSHAREEEMFFVLEGEPSIRTLSGTIRCRKGDFIAFPVGVGGTHQLLNESNTPATVLLLGRTEGVEACYYPDSDKLLVDTETPIANGNDSIMVRAHPQLEYFNGET